MTSAGQIVLPALLVGTVILQAVLVRRRLQIVLMGALASVVAGTILGVATMGQVLREVPWDVLIILVGLNYYTQVLARSGLFDRLALMATRLSGARPARMLIVFYVVMFLVSGLVNNLTALLLILPVHLIVLKLTGATPRLVHWSVGLLLVSCNLGGASTPIGDFPAILLLGRGAMTFRDYLMLAWPLAAVAAAGLLAIGLVLVRPQAGVADSPLGSQLSVRIVEALYRRVRLDTARFVGPAACLGAMLIGWMVLDPTSGYSPDVMCWAGAGIAVMLLGDDGDDLLRRGFEAESVLFLLALFVMVGAVRTTGLFARLAALLCELPVRPMVRLTLFLVLTGVITGIFSAGPSMAAMLEVAQQISTQFPPHAVYVGLALSVCAGSSLFLTAATSGPLAQSLVDRAGLVDPQGRPLRFGFADFVPVGLLSFVWIQAVAVACAVAMSFQGGP